MNRLFKLAAIACAGAACSLGSALAGTVDFNSLSNGDDITGVDLGGVTITRGANTVIVTSASPASTGNTIQGGSFVSDDPFRADFSEAGVTYVQVDMGDFNQDADDLFLRAYDSSDNLIGETLLSIAGSFVGMETLSVMTATAIAYVTFGTTGPDFLNSIYADNLIWRTSDIPLPAALPLMLMGLGGLGFASRRKKA